MADQHLLYSLHYYVNTGKPLPDGFDTVEYDFVNYFQVEQPPDIRCSEKIYCFVDCFYKPDGLGDRLTRDRQTWDKMGQWKATNGQEAIYKNDQIVGYKQRFKFHRLEAGRAVPTAWLMTEYTLYSNRIRNMKAICELWKSREV